MRRAAQLLSRVFTMQLGEWRLLFESAIALLRAYWKVRHQPFSELAPNLGTLSSETTFDLLSKQQLEVKKIAWANHVFMRFLPIKPTCLMQAVAAHELLRRRKISCTMYFGVAPGKGSAGNDINAHAWLRAGPVIVTGKHESAKFKPLAWFASIDYQ
jgi:hypothetical protein